MARERTNFIAAAAERVGFGMAAGRGDVRWAAPGPLVSAKLMSLGWDEYYLWFDV
jgi:hypothetical protein